MTVEEGVRKQAVPREGEEVYDEARVGLLPVDCKTGTTRVFYTNSNTDNELILVNKIEVIAI